MNSLYNIYFRINLSIKVFPLNISFILKDMCKNLNKILGPPNHPAASKEH